jgi:predicted ATP-grasp superfamily ATP-dependent carboligase
MSPTLEIDALPQLREPTLVVALSGWVDAGLAGIGTIAVLRDHLGAARRFGRMDLSEVMDLQQTRPTIHLAGGVQREIDWPQLEFEAGNVGLDVVLCSGPEPSLQWRAVLGQVVDLARQLGVKRAYTLGGIPAMASHRRRVEVLTTATSEELAEATGAWRQDYEGPTGAQSVLQVLLGEAGIPCVGLWAQVPHYLAASASPPAIRSLLVRLREIAGVDVDLTDLEGQAIAYIQRVEEGLAERPDVVDIIQAIEDADDTAPEVDDLPEGDLPSGDELASEIERFLRGQ